MRRAKVKPARRRPDPFGRARHDHTDCLAQAMHAAERLCALRGARLTKLRRRVLELVWRSHDPVGAYAILDALREDGRAAAPPTVYRALDFLSEQGLVHRIEFAQCLSRLRRPRARPRQPVPHLRALRSRLRAARRPYPERHRRQRARDRLPHPASHGRGDRPLPELCPRGGRGLSSFQAGRFCEPLSSNAVQSASVKSSKAPA